MNLTVNSTLLYLLDYQLVMRRFTVFITRQCADILILRVCLPVRLFVRPLRSGILWKRLNISS